MSEYTKCAANPSLNFRKLTLASINRDECEKTDKHYSYKLRVTYY